MPVTRLAFLSHFVLCLAMAAGAYFAWRAGVVQTVWTTDLSMMTSAIAALFVGTAVWLGWQAWLADCFIDPHRVSAEFGHLAERLAVIFGFVGTAIGLSLQAHSLAGGATSFQALATSLYTTFTGGAAAAGIAIITYSLEQGIKRARR